MTSSSFPFALLPLHLLLLPFPIRQGIREGSGWNGLRLHGREGRERRCVVIPLLPRPAPPPPPAAPFVPEGSVAPILSARFPLCLFFSGSHCLPASLCYLVPTWWSFRNARGIRRLVGSSLCFVFCVFPSSSSSFFCSFSVFVLLQAGQATVRRAVFSFRTVIQIFGNQW